MHLAGAYSCESEVAAATRWNRVALASSVSLLKLVSVRPSGGVDILDKAGTGPEDIPEGQIVAAELGGYGNESTARYS